MFVKFFSIAFLMLLILCPAKAEYRVFVLKIEEPTTKSSRQFLSTLDPEQYQTIFPLGPNQKISYVDTWRCLGRTDFYTPLCDKLKPAATAEGPNSRQPASVAPNSPK